MGDGEFYSKKTASQLVSFSGMRYERNITPTDIDGVLDFAGKVFVFFELKRINAPLPYGQLLAYTNIIDGLQGNGKDALFIIARHDQEYPNIIDAKIALVEKRYYKNKWTYPDKNKEMSLSETINSFLRFINKSF